MLKRTPLKRGTGTLKRSNIKKKSKSPEQIQQNKEDGKRMLELFDECWNELKVKWCQSCGIPVMGPNTTLYWHHLLPKGLDRYKHLKFEKDNLMFLCQECHSNHENGKSTDRIQDRTQQTKIRFDVI